MAEIHATENPDGSGESSGWATNYLLDKDNNDDNKDEGDDEDERDHMEDLLEDGEKKDDPDFDEIIGQQWVGNIKLKAGRSAKQVLWWHQAGNKTKSLFFCRLWQKLRTALLPIEAVGQCEGLESHLSPFPDWSCSYCDEQ